MKSRLFLNVVIGESSSIFKLLSSENEALLIGRNTLFVLDLGLDVINRVRRLDLQRNGLSSQGLDKDLHTSTETED